MGKYEDLAKRVGKLVDLKNAAYGNSFDTSGDFLRLLWPQGCPPDQYDDLLAMARIFDKMKRIATDRDALGESPYQDISGYGLLGLFRVERVKRDAEIVKRAKEMEEKFAAQAEETTLNKEDDSSMQEAMVWGLSATDKTEK